MKTHPYTHALWRVQPEDATRFVAAWDELAAIFSALPAPPLWGTLLRSEVEPGLFYSFGPWQRREDIDAMRADPTVQAAFARLRELCIEMTPGVYGVVRQVVV